MQALTEYKVALNIMEIKRPERDAQLTAENIAQQLKTVSPSAAAMKQARAAP